MIQDESRKAQKEIFSNPSIVSCVLTVCISQTKSMSTKNPKLGKIMLQYKILLKGQDIYVYLFLMYHIFIEKCV